MKYELIVLLDDNDNTLFVNEDILSDYFPGTKIKTFNHPNLFLSAFSELEKTYQRKWLLVLDLNMPEFTGYKLLDHLEESSYSIDNLDVIILTSSNQKIDIEKSEVYMNIIAYLDKPLSEEKLRSKYIFP